MRDSVWKPGLNRFRRDDDGSVSAFTCVTMLLMVVSAGMAVDFMRFESYRAEMQNAVDRGVLAAASLQQTHPVEDTIEGYFRATNYLSGNVNINVDPQITENSRQISATVDTTVDTYFLRLIGINELSIAVNGAAIESRQDIEVSLALDISGSMARERTGEFLAANPESGATYVGGPQQSSRLSVLRQSAQEFVDLVLTDDATDRTTITLIPYAGQVNLGATIFDEINNFHQHSYSSCVEFSDADFQTTNLPGVSSRSQVPHFQWFSFEGASGHEADWGWCPSDAQAIEYFSNDAQALKDRIADFRGHDGTGTNNAMKWAVGLLDPDSRWITQRLVSAGEVDSSFSNRPVAHTDTETLKFVVLMTDGNTRFQQRPLWFRHNSASEREDLANERLLPLALDHPAPLNQWLRFFTNSQLDNDELLRRQQLTDPVDDGDSVIGMCERAKAQGIIIFTIGFDVEVGSPAHTDMSQCASSSSHFFDVDGLELNDAFSAIAATIQKLKLIL